MSFDDKFYPLDTHPMPLDIVWCRFPEDEFPRKPAPKSRPVLVRTVEYNVRRTQAWIHVSYGTTKRTPPKNFPHDLHIYKSTEVDNCGLLRATSFVLDRTAVLPWSPLFFVTRPDDGAGPIVGKLSPNRQERLAQLVKFRSR